VLKKKGMFPANTKKTVIKFIVVRVEGVFLKEKQKGEKEKECRFRGKNR